MPVHVVRQGECVESIAYAQGLAWETVWQHANNADLRKLRSEPNELLPGDELFVPDRTAKDVSCKTEARHRFRRKGVPSRLEVQFLDEDGKPRTGSFELDVDGTTITGQLANGWIREWVMPDVGEAKVRLKPVEVEQIEGKDDVDDEFDDQPGSTDDGSPKSDVIGDDGSGDDWEEHTIGLGHLDPSDALTGVQGRLLNLGYYDGPVDGKESEDLELAIALFQATEDLDATGVLDDQTKAAIIEAAGGKG